MVAETLERSLMGTTRMRKVCLYLPDNVWRELRRRLKDGRRNRWMVQCLCEGLGQPELMDEYRRPGRPRAPSSPKHRN